MSNAISVERAFARKRRPPRNSPEPTEDEIRRRAYEIYLSHAGCPGDPGADWQQAELELRARAALFANKEVAAF